MREAVIVSTARTPIGRAFKGAFNATKSPTLLAHAIRNAVARSGVDSREIEDVVIGCVLTAGNRWQQHRAFRQPRRRASL